MMISKINLGMSKIGFGSTRAEKTKKEEPLILNTSDYHNVPKGYHVEHDIDHDRFYQVKDGYTLNDRGAAVPVGQQYDTFTPSKKVEVGDDLVLSTNDYHDVPKGYHVEYDIDCDRYYQVKDGYHMDSDGCIVKNNK